MEVGTELERETRTRIEELRQQLHQEMKGALTPRQLTGLLPISQEIDRLSVALIRRRWARAETGQAEGNSSRL